ncbi:transposase, partial [Brevibacillus laterosporus]|uniref:transposase n=1 Tax=Brevibacillus laterosporus TaxID=1465 RepID=UPI0034DD65F3
MVLSPLSRQCKKPAHLTVGGTLYLEGIFLWRKKGQKFKRYSEEFKLKAVNLYQERGMSYKAITKALGIPSSTQ